MSDPILSIKNPLMKTYCVYMAVLGIKMILMSFLTAFQRSRKGALANPEDVRMSPNAAIKVDDDVERVRRAHLNDLENITVFMIVSFAYILTEPSADAAAMLFRIYTVSRYVHTFVYTIWVIPQPARFLSFLVGACITVYMCGAVVAEFIDEM